MKTTIDIDDAVLVEAKRRAAEAGMTLRAYVEDALRDRLLARPASETGFELDLPVVHGERRPAVEVADRRALYDLMEGDE